MLQRPEQRDAATDQRLEKLRQAHAELNAAITLTESFATLIRARDAAALDPWLEQAASSTLKPFQSFATNADRWLLDHTVARAAATKMDADVVAISLAW